MTLLDARRRLRERLLGRSFLWLLSLAYGSVVLVRRALYDWGLLKPQDIGAKVVCIGNLTAGGTGKTPAVAWVVEILKKAGRKPAILTRGYGGDESILLGRLLPGVPVIVDPDRVAGAAKAVSGGANVLVMDDGFQHMRLHRDLDVRVWHRRQC